MAPTSDPNTTNSPLAGEHAAFRNMVREIKTELNRLQSDPCSQECLLRLFRSAESMRERLKSHFVREESAWERRSAELDASTQRWVHLLVEQHRDMEKLSDQVCAQLDECVRSRSAMTPLCDEAMRALLRDLTMHELSEDRLFQRTIFEDLDGA